MNARIVGIKRHAGVLIAAVLALTVISASPAEAAPLRSGEILGGIYSTGPWLCHGTPDCRAWLASGCDPAMRGAQNPALFTSIVDVKELAGSRRTFRGRLQAPTVYAGGLVIEFWNASCGRIPVGDHVYLKGRLTRDTQFRIPSRARWMTVVSSDCVLVDWTLR